MSTTHSSPRGIHILLAAVLTLLIFYPLDAQNVNPPKGSFKYNYNLYKGMQWREIGPFRGGRSVAVAGHPDQPYTYYFGGTGGGVWKTTDGGITWLCISDSLFQTGSVGAIAVAESDPNVIYVGMGEGCIRGNVAPGDGVYKSEDGGKTWKHVGLAETQTIGRVRVHPKDHNLVYVAALGHVFGPNSERGVFRSKDGGKTWQKILHKNDKAGAIDLVLDPNNPRILYASLWEAQRGPWFMSSGGPGSGLYKSTDGGDTWTDISRNPGMPKGTLGRIGVAASYPKADRVWAMVEAEDGGLFRSEDGGNTWRRVNEDRRLRQRAWYYTHVYADTKNPDLVYVLNVQFLKSIDGGRTFTTLRVPHGDNHDLWIDPNDNMRMINANDGGANVSYNGGQSWTDQDQATAQFYHVLVDNRFPYHVYGAQQDNSTIAIASRTTGFGIDRPDWHPVGGGESGYIAVREEGDNIIAFAGNYGGYLTRYDHRTRQQQAINVWPENPMGGGVEGMKYRFQWTFPIVISPHDSKVLYVTGNHVFRSTNDGMSWEIISPDLTRNDKSKQGPSGGPITKDNTGVEYYCTIFSFVESPLQKGLFWAGSDDGLIHVSRDGGASWQNVSIPLKDLPDWPLISLIEASPHDPGTAYVAATRYKQDDFKPYIFKTSDYGKTWKKIVNGIPANEYTRAVREDPHKKGLLYCGTERGVYVSFDDGNNWQSLQMNLPVVPIHDLVVQKREKDLVVATHGRSFWILDDLTPLHQIGDELAKADVYLFQPRHAYRMRGGSANIPGIPVGKNPPNGAVIFYYFKSKPEGEVKLDILDSKGGLVKSFSSKIERREDGEQDEFAAFFGGGQGQQRVSAEAGMNRFVWDFRYPDAVTVPGALLWSGTTRGPLCVPGTYQVRLTVGGKSYTQSFEVKPDPRIPTTQEQYQAQFDLSMKILNKLSEAHKAVNAVRDARKQFEELVKRVKDHSSGKKVADAAKELDKKLSAVEEEIIQVKIRSNQDALNYPIKLNNKLAALLNLVQGSESGPTKQSADVFADLSTRLETQLATLKQVMETDLPAFNKLVKEQDIPAVFLKAEEKQED
ncbi:MAG TPA: glycosyl hydrolase [Bacteroidota bacterium]|nr:glycosyl hydrolase [Bacteroidota bacterium]